MRLWQHLGLVIVALAGIFVIVAVLGFAIG